MWRYVGIAAILAIACILPFAVSGYHVSQFSQVLIHAKFRSESPALSFQYRAAPWTQSDKSSGGY